MVTQLSYKLKMLIFPLESTKLSTKLMILLSLVNRAF